MSTLWDDSDPDLVIGLAGRNMTAAPRTFSRLGPV